MTRKPDKESHYKNIIAKQKATIRSLQKQLAHATKNEIRYQDLEEKEAEELIREELEEKEFVSVEKCPKCKHELDIIVNSGKVKVYDCSNCDYRATRRR